MKIAVSFPTTYQLIEKLCVLFDEIDIIGFNGEYCNQEKKYNNELKKKGAKINLHRENYDDINPYQFDLLIDSWETRFYNKGWRKSSLLWKIPRILKILWYKNPEKIEFTDKEISIFNRSIVSGENKVITDRWKNIGMANTKILLYPPGDWWFSGLWGGNIRKALFVLNVNNFRNIVTTGLGDWQKICNELPDNTFHQNASENKLTSLELADFCKRFRCYVNLDQTKNARPLCLVFTEMISAGIPPLIIRCPGTDYYRYIENGKSGFICKNIEDMIDKIKKLLNDYDLSKSMSDRTRKIARENFSKSVLKPHWDEAIELSQNLI